MWRVYSIWLDVIGNTRLVSNNYSAAPFGNLDAVLLTLSNAVVSQYSQGTVTSTGLIPVNAGYVSVYTAGYVTVLDAAGLESIIVVPAIKLSAVAADGVTILPATLAAILAAAIADGYVSAIGASPVSAPTGIVRMTGKQR